MRTGLAAPIAANRSAARMAASRLSCLTLGLGNWRVVSIQARSAGAVARPGHHRAKTVAMTDYQPTDRPAWNKAGAPPSLAARPTLMKAGRCQSLVMSWLYSIPMAE